MMWLMGAYIDHAPGISSTTYLFSIDVENTIGSDDGKRKLGIDVRLLWKLVEFDLCSHNLSHDLLLETGKLFRSQCIGFSNHWDDVHLTMECQVFLILRSEYTQFFWPFKAFWESSFQGPSEQDIIEKFPKKGTIFQNDYWWVKSAHWSYLF